MPRMLSTVLREDGYIQGTGVLFSMDSNGVQRNCCLGVMECAIGMTFHWRGPSMEWVDVLGGNQMPSQDVQAATDLDLGVTPNEEYYFEEVNREYDTCIRADECTRADALAAINDAGLSFEYVANVLEELGWDVNLDRLAVSVEELTQEVLF